ncbi:MAG TPA: hypothetical protein VFA18_02050 [Gemmataceae bacterium]|nr:hypothetical protein [Gemmataceae bacterium]
MKSYQCCARWVLSTVAVLALLPLPARSIGDRDGQVPLEKIGIIRLKGIAGPLDHLTVDAAHARLFVANQSNDTLDVVDLRTGKLIKQITGQKEVHGVAWAPTLDRLFVGTGGGTCNALDGRALKLLKTFPVPDADNVRFDPRSNRVYVAGEKKLAVIDGRTLQPVGTVELPGSPEGFQVEQGKHRLYVNTSDPNEVAVIDTEKNTVTGRYPLKEVKAPEALAMDAHHRRLFVGCRQPSAIVVLDSESGKEITRVAIPGGVDDMFFDAERRRIYASCGQGFVAVLQQADADHYDLLAKIPTIKGAKTSFFDASRGRLYLAVPRQLGRDGPEVWKFRARP